MTIWTNVSATLPTYVGLGVVVRRDRGLSALDVANDPWDAPDEGIPASVILTLVLLVLQVEVGIETRPPQ
jgi:hypothetical protein